MACTHFKGPVEMEKTKCNLGRDFIDAYVSRGACIYVYVWVAVCLNGSEYK